MKLLPLYVFRIPIKKQVWERDIDTYAPVGRIMPQYVVRCVFWDILDIFENHLKNRIRKSGYLGDPISVGNPYIIENPPSQNTKDGRLELWAGEGQNPFGVKVP